MEWRDTSTHRLQKGEFVREPRELRANAGAFCLCVHRHIHYAADAWLFSCEPIANCIPLAAKDITEAKAEAERRFRRALTDALASDVQHSTHER
jgi:hypothetical protein